MAGRALAKRNQTGSRQSRILRRHWISIEGSLIGMQSQPDLSKIVLALKAASGFARFLDGRQQHASRHQQNGNYHQNLNQGQPRPARWGKSTVHGRFSRFLAASDQFFEIENAKSKVTQPQILFDFTVF
jgi:hypothetical protein